MSEPNGRIKQLLAQARADTEEKTSVSAAERALPDQATAERVYRQLREKLFLVDRWNAESVAMNFALFSAGGEQISGKSGAVGDFIRITLPGIGKSDWVKIIDVFESRDETILTVRPTFDPTEKSGDKSVTSHFFTDESTNNFCLRCNEKKINMYVIGLNEVTNTEQASGIIESARNLATANLGHYLGFQKAAWTNFCENFLESEKL